MPHSHQVKMYNQCKLSLPRGRLLGMKNELQKLKRLRGRLMQARLKNRNNNNGKLKHRILHRIFLKKLKLTLQVIAPNFPS